jgi:hypothetical protein
MREHNYLANFYQYAINAIHNMITDTEADQTIEDAIREHFRNDIIEEEKKKNIKDFKFLRNE